MPRISSYPQDTNVTGNDIWIGSDGDNGLITKNFTADSLGRYYKNNNTFAASSFVFSQSSAASTWTISHNLNKFPSVTVVDSSGNVVVGYINYNNMNQITLTFTAPFSGKAYLN
jgi:hypothetical protein